MSNTLSVTLMDWFMNKMEKDVAIPLKPKFCYRYVHSTYNRRNKIQPDRLFERINKYDTNINLTFEVNSSKFPDTKTYGDNTAIKCFAYYKEMKLSFHQTSPIPNHYKQEDAIGELHCVKNLSSNFEQEVTIIRDKHIKAGYLFRFINSVIDRFNQVKEDPLIPTSLFEERIEISFQIYFWKRNKNEISRVIDKLKAFTNYKVKSRSFFKTRKARSLFVSE